MLTHGCLPLGGTHFKTFVGKITIIMVICKGVYLSAFGAVPNLLDTFSGHTDFSERLEVWTPLEIILRKDQRPLFRSTAPALERTDSCASVPQPAPHDPRPPSLCRGPGTPGVLQNAAALPAPGPPPVSPLPTAGSTGTGSGSRGPEGSGFAREMRRLGSGLASP